MAQTSKIEWTEVTWNPITGCTKISPGCRHCYAERMARRLAGRHGYPKRDPFRVTFHPDRLRQPLRWRKPSMVFVCSMSDFFHAEVHENHILEVLAVIKQCPQHTFQILTKRSGRMAALSSKLGEWPPNVWMGVTVEARECLSRIDDLKSVQAPVRFLSCEPLLEDLGALDLRGIDWVICGGESGPKSRPMQPEWARHIRDQCVAEGIPYFFKQWGGVNKKRNGRVLDGRTWDGMPLVESAAKGRQAIG